MESYLGTIQAFGFNFAPRGWAQCHGQLLPIAQNQALFSLLRTTYGGDGRTTFALPDLRGSVLRGDNGVTNPVTGGSITLANGTDTKALNINFCICIEGIFPSRY